MGEVLVGWRGKKCEVKCREGCEGRGVRGGRVGCEGRKGPHHEPVLQMAGGGGGLKWWLVDFQEPLTERRWSLHLSWLPGQ